ncbi:alpha/beta fold hydrolase [Myxosarcina sp. GI1(2024)]
MNLKVEIKGRGYPILCLHGHPGSAASMSVFTNYLARQYRTIAPDLRGYGRSRVRGNFNMADHLSDLQALLDRDKINRCLLLGWSLGGILALELALASPERFSGLILIASAARPCSSHPAVNWQDLLFTGVGGIVNYLVPGWQWNIDTFGKRSLFRYLVVEQTPAAYCYLARQGVPAYLQTSAAASRALNQAISQGYNRLEDLEKIEVPCLVLAGESDRHITVDSSRETARNLKHCQWKSYPRTAHLFPWEMPQLVLSDIQQWLKSNPEVVTNL